MGRVGRTTLRTGRVRCNRGRLCGHYYTTQYHTQHVLSGPVLDLAYSRTDAHTYELTLVRNIVGLVFRVSRKCGAIETSKYTRHRISMTVNRGRIDARVTLKSITIRRNQVRVPGRQHR